MRAGTTPPPKGSKMSWSLADHASGIAMVALVVAGVAAGILLQASYSASELVFFRTASAGPAMAFKVAGSLPVWVALGGWLWISGRPGEAARAVLPVAIVFLGSIPVFRCPSHWSDISGHAFLYMLAITPFALVRRPDVLVQGLGWLLAATLAFMAVCTAAVFHSPKEMIAGTLVGTVPVLVVAVVASLAGQVLGCGSGSLWPHAILAALAAVANLLIVTAMPVTCAEVTLGPGGHLVFDAVVAVSSIVTAVLADAFRRPAARQPKKD